MREQAIEPTYLNKFGSSQGPTIRRDERERQRKEDDAERDGK
jgi:hypothetical protein